MDRQMDMYNKPFRVTDVSREIRLGLTASTLDQFEERARAKMDIDMDLAVRIVLESDGTEIDDNDYFDTLEPNTCLMILVQEERWTPYKSNFILGLAVESENGLNSGPGSPVEELIWRLHQDLSFFPWLTLKELETIAKMDREEMRHVVPDPNFLEFLQTLCERYLQDKEKYGDDGETTQSSTAQSNNPPPPNCCSTNGTTMNGKITNGTSSASSLLNDPIKLIRLYSKFNNMKAQNGGNNGSFFSFSSCGSEESLASLHQHHQPINNVATSADHLIHHQLPPLPQHQRPTTPHKQPTN